MDSQLWTDPQLWAFVAAAFVLGGFTIWLFMRNRRSRGLRDRFGDEYHRTVAASERRGQAERELEQREERVAHLDIRPLSQADRDRFLERWGRIQSRFVDEPRAAVAEADELLEEVMRTRGYPTEDFEHNAADLSVNYPAFVESYRAAYAIKTHRGDAEADTEELRRAMIHYRALFAHLLEDDAPDGVPTEIPERSERRAEPISDPPRRATHVR